jgi:predicted ATPase
LCPPSLGAQLLDTLPDAAEGLALLGAPLPLADPDIEAAVAAEQARLELAMAAGGLEAVVALPDMTDARALAVVRLMDRVIMASYCAGRIRLVHLLTLRMLALVLEWGHSAVTCLALPLYANFFHTRLKRYEEGYALGRAALQIMDHFQDQTRRGQFNVTMATAVAHWKGSLEVRFGDGLPLLDKVAADVPLSSRACALLRQSG